MTNRPEVYVTIFYAEGDSATWLFDTDQIEFECSTSGTDGRAPVTATIRASECRIIDYSHGGHS